MHNLLEKNSIEKHETKAWVKSIVLNNENEAIRMNANVMQRISNGHKE